MRQLLAETRKSFAPAADTGGSWADQFSSQPAPTAAKLIAEYKGIVYSCATLNSQSTAAAERRAYVQTAPGQRKCRWAVGPVGAATKRRMRSAKALRAGVAVEEILEHPLITLLEQPNQYMSGSFLKEMTALYLDLVGSAYWYVERGKLREPVKIWLLQSHLVTADRDPSTGMVERWTVGSGQKAETYTLEDIVDFHLPDPNNPYSQGLSPARAAWEAVNLLGKDKSHQASVMDNRARPDVIVSPKDSEAVMTPAMADRLEKILSRKFRKAGAGKMMVEGTPLTVTPLNFTNADMELLARYGVNKVEILNAYGVPPALFESNKSRAELEAALVQHSRMAVLPRLRRLDDRINQVLCPMFDDRLFTMSEDPTPDDVERRILSHESQLRTGERVINELRVADGQEPVDWGDAPWIPNTVIQPIPASLAGSDVGQDVEVTREAVLDGAQIAAAMAIVTAVAGRQIPRDSGVGQLMVLFNLSKEQAEAILGTAGAGFEKPAPPVQLPPAQGVPATPKPGEVGTAGEDVAKRVLVAIRRSAGKAEPLALADILGLQLSEVQGAIRYLQGIGLVSGNGSRT